MWGVQNCHDLLFLSWSTYSAGDPDHNPTQQVEKTVMDQKKLKNCRSRASGAAQSVECLWSMWEIMDPSTTRTGWNSTCLKFQRGKAEVRGPEVLKHPWSCNKLKDSQGYMILSQRTKQNNRGSKMVMSLKPRNLSSDAQHPCKTVWYGSAYLYCQHWGGGESWPLQLTGHSA